MGSGRPGITHGRPARGGGGRLSPTNVRTRRKETYECKTGGPLLMWWTAPAPGIEVP